MKGSAFGREVAALAAKRLKELAKFWKTIRTGKEPAE